LTNAEAAAAQMSQTFGKAEPVSQAADRVSSLISQNCSKMNMCLNVTSSRLSNSYIGLFFCGVAFIAPRCGVLEDWDAAEDPAFCVFLPL
jgi:hypothetical protein